MQLNDTMSWNQLKMNWKWTFAYKHLFHLLINTYFNHFNENKLICIETLRKLFWFFFFFLRHIEVSLRTSAYICFYKSAAPDNINLRYLALFYENLCSAAVKFSYFTLCGNIYATPKQLNSFELDHMLLF